MDARRPRALLEREAELKRIETLLTAIAQGGGGCTVIEGEAGIGKTSLLHAGAADARARGHRVLSARGAELEREFGYGVIHQLIDPVVRRASRATIDELLSGAAALAAPIVAPAEADSPGKAGPDATFAAQHGLYWFLDNLASQAPVLLVVDDAQWGDIVSLRFLLYLVRRLEGLAIGVVFGWRTGEPGAPVDLLEALRDEPLVETIRPEPLSSDATSNLIRSEVGAMADARFARASHAATGGNPFLVRELLDAVSRGEIAATEEGARRVRELGLAGIARNVFVRLARLDPAAAALARAVAVLDADSEPALAASLAGLASSDEPAAAAALADAGIFARGDPLRFAHPILRGAVYGELGHAERERLHRQAARILDEAGAADRAAAHLLPTQPTGDPWVGGALAQAGERAIQRGATETALALLERALAEPPGGDRAQVLLLLGIADQLAGRASAGERLQEAIDVSEDPEIRWQAAFHLARQLNIRLQHSEAVAVLESVLDEQRSADPSRALVTEAHIAYNGLMADSAARAAGERIEEIARQCTGSSESEGMVLVAAAFHRGLAMHGTADQAADLLRRARVTERFVPLLHRTSTAFWACGALLWAGRLEEARSLSDAVLAQAQRTGGVLWVAAASVWRALAAYLLGDLRDADAYLNDSLDAAVGKFPLILPGTVGLAAELLRLRGNVEAADATLASYGFAHAPAPRHATAHVLNHARAALRIEQHRPDDALRDAEAILISERERGGIIPGVRPNAALAFHAAGDTAAALDVAGRDLKVAERWGVPAHVGIALRTLGLLEGGAAGLEQLRASVRELKPSPYRLELASSQIEYGAALRRANERKAAREPLLQGLELAQRCGALALAKRARDELRATGARPRNLLLTGVDSLTPSERRTAQLAAKGLSNREIAQTLFVTKKTVETHLRHVFQKLDIRARTELPDALAETRPPRTKLAMKSTSEAETAPVVSLDRPQVKTVLFTDIVDSTKRLSQLGERRWRDLHNRYEELVRQELGRFGGDEVKTLGDGFLAIFDSVTAAARCAQQLAAAAPGSLGLALRAGIHCGEVELKGSDVRGLAVNIAARIVGLADAGEVLCSGTVVDLAVGSDLRFVERGEFELKGLSQRWRVCALA